MKLFEFFGQLEVTEAPKRFPDGHYTHTPGALEVMPTQDKTLWADAGELPKKFNVTKMKIAIYDEQDDEDPYSYGNGGLLVYHNAGTWKMYTDDVTRVQIADYLGIANKDIDFSEQGMQDEEYMHFDIEDDAVAQLIDKGAFKLEESTTEDDMSTGVVQVGKKGKTRRATGIDDNPYDHNEGEDQTALANAALWNMKDVYQTLMSGESLSEDDMFSYGDLVQYLEQADMPDHYSKFWVLVVDAINKAGGFAGQGSELQVDKNIAPQIKTLYQQFKAATAKIKGVKEGRQKDEREDMEADASDMSKAEFIKAHGEAKAYIWDRVQAREKGQTNEGRVKDMMLDMEADAADMSKEEFVKTHGEKYAYIWDKVQGQMSGDPQYDESHANEDRGSDSVVLAKLKQAVGGEEKLVLTLLSSAVQNNMDDDEFIDAASRMLNMPPQEIQTIIDNDMNPQRDEDSELEDIMRLSGRGDAMEAKKSKPDYLDFDKDGDKKEPMKKALADKKKK